jgi:nicotinamidase-related amidase
MKALILIDFINEIVVNRGYIKSLEEDFFENLSKTIKKARENWFLIIHVRVGFSKNYPEMPSNSPLFSKAKEYWIMQFWTDSTEFYNKNDIEDSDIIIEKNRVSAFYSTKLELILKTNEIKDIFIAWIATDFTISSTAREARDRDFNVTVLWDLCSSLPIEDHENELKILQKLVNIKNSNEIF